MNAPGLPGLAAPAKRGKGRPKGSMGKRAKDVREYIAAKFGGSAAQQSASFCMITPAELRAAGNSMAKAQVNKALDLVRHVREAQDGRDEILRELVREAVRDLAVDLPAETSTALREAVNACVRRVKEATAGFGLRDALELIVKERAALLPYTDQRLSQVDVTSGGEKLLPTIIMPDEPEPASLGHMDDVMEFQIVSDGQGGQVAQSKSHGSQETLDL